MGDLLRLNLDRLLAAHPLASPAVQARANDMPLANSLAIDTLALVVAAGALRSQREQVRMGTRSHIDPTCSEARLLTDNCVFTYAGAFRYHAASLGEPGRGVGIMFSSQLEVARADSSVATPFDSGGVFHGLRPRDNEEERIRFVRDHEMPVPGYRELLGRLLQACFSSVRDYLNEIGPCTSWPIEVQGGDARRWTFEIRFTTSIPISQHVEAVFLPHAASNNPALMGQIARWTTDGVHVRRYRTQRGSHIFDSLASAGREYIYSNLGL